MIKIKSMRRQAKIDVRSERIFLMGKYEILYIVHPDLEASIDKILERVREIIAKRGGQVTYEENWGKRKLAYEIKKTEVGIYLLWFFEAPKENISKIERDLRLTEEIMRYMILATPEKLKTAKTKGKAVPEKTQKKPETTRTEEGTPAKVTKKIVKKKEEKPKTESEEERMKQINEKLGAILGDESDNKKTSVKSKKEKE